MFNHLYLSNGYSCQIPMTNLLTTQLHIPDSPSLFVPLSDQDNAFAHDV